MLILGIDPGPRTSGLVLYSTDMTGPGVVVQAVKDASFDTVRQFIDGLAGMDDACVVTERTQAGPPSTQVVLTTEVVGRIMELACIELHGGDKTSAVGTKKNPGPLYGVSSHAWQALGVVCAHVLPWHPSTEGHNEATND